MTAQKAPAFAPRLHPALVSNYHHYEDNLCTEVLLKITKALHFFFFFQFEAYLTSSSLAPGLVSNTLASLPCSVQPIPVQATGAKN